ncbi:GNAT family N-acetyltransferase [Cohnella sp.]|uniref:GNAT family N-acetyltransferase n=1 Tax=Cohnella sp. TaxID=1883426 RepID=UPI003565BB58
MELSLSKNAMTEEEGNAISQWRYPAPYDRYRWPVWETMVEHGLEFGDPSIRQAQYQAVHDKHTHRLVGYIQLFPMGQTMRIGMGLRPDCCDQGWGSALTALAVEEASRRLPGAEIDLEVEQWNKRAIRAYEKAGFIITDEYDRQATHGTVSVFCMVWNNK